MKSRCFIFLSIVVLLLGGTVFPASADGIIIPEPPPCRDVCPPWPRPMAQLEIKYHHVDVDITDQLAVTHVDQVFYNPNDWAVEGTYLFPLPLDAVVSEFTLWVDGEPVQGKVLSADEARRIYNEIIMQQRDPALLEYAGRGAVQASIFPIPPGGERRIELRYSQILPVQDGLVRYSYPLNTEKFSSKPLNSVKVSVVVKAEQPIRAVYSPSHSISMTRSDDGGVKASYEAANITPDRDFDIFISIGETQAFHLLTYRDPGDQDNPDGFFVLLLAPKPENVSAVAKDVILVLDKSGSMDGEKFRQAQSAARYILQHLNTEDRFALITFSSGIETFAPELQPAGNAAAAVTWIDAQSAAGSTDINRALLEAAAIASKERPTYLIFLTDGLPTEGEVNSQKILDNFTRLAAPNLRLFAFGVGYDVDTVLLDSLTQDHHGLSTYVKPGEILDEVLSGFYQRISSPVLTDMSLDFGGLSTYDIFPTRLPDLFAGNQAVIVGRYREGGVFDLQVKGMINGEERVYSYPQQRFIEDSRGMVGATENLPRLWATRKVGYLLNQIRLEGVNQEIIDQIIRLSIRYGIITPYTSYLVTETMPLGMENQHELAQETFRAMQNLPAAAPSGMEAVNKADAARGYSQAQAPIELSAEAWQKVRIVGSRTFVLADGKWLDTQFDPDRMVTQKVAFLSDDYFMLAGSRLELGAALALGERVVVVIDGQAFEIIAEGSSVEPLISTPQVIPTPIRDEQQMYPTQSSNSTAQNPICMTVLLPLLVLLAALLQR